MTKIVSSRRKSEEKNLPILELFQSRPFKFTHKHLIFFIVFFSFHFGGLYRKRKKFHE